MLTLNSTKDPGFTYLLIPEPMGEILKDDSSAYLAKFLFQTFIFTTITDEVMFAELKNALNKFESD